MRKITPGILKKFRVFIILIFTGLAGFAQGQLTGKVINPETGLPVPGVTVTLKGTKTAVQTSTDGSFLITAPNNSTLIFTYVGYETKEAVAAAGVPLELYLPVKSGSLEEVVVVGYGTQRKREVTGAISKVSSAEITATAAPSFEASLQGRVAGVQVSQSSGLAGAGSYVRIRGIASVSAGGDPLYVIDGIPVSSDPLALEGNAGPNSSGYKLRSGFTQSPLASINPDDIESIEILKDAGAAGIYGSRGANGVILVTTKRGKLGKPMFNFSTKLGFVTPSVKPKLASGAQWLQLRQEAWENDGHTGQAPLPNGMTWAEAQGNNTNWFDLLTRTGFTQDYNLSMTYGLKKLRTYVGGTYGSDQSYAVGNKFDRASIRANVDYTFSPKFKALLNSSFSSGINHRVPTGWAGGIGAAMSEALPIFAPYKSDGTYTTYRNPLITINEDKFRSDDKRLLGGLSLIFSPAKNFDLKGTANVDNYQNITDQYHNDKIYGANNLNNAERWKTNVMNYNFNATANYRLTLNSSNSFSFLIGGEYQEATTKSRHYYKRDSTVNEGFYKDESLLNTATVDLPKNFPRISQRDSTIADRWSFISYFGRINYAFRNKLFLQALARVDGSSKFGSNNKYGFFPAVSAGYILSDENFIRNTIPQLNYLKIRASYGITGNASIPSFGYLDNWNYSAGNGNAPYNGNATLAQTKVANPDLKWETANNFDAGLEFGLFNNKLSGEVAYYNKRSKDVLMNISLEEGYGIGANTVFRNIGEIKNSGVELSLNLKVVDKEDLSVVLFANTAHNTNEVVSAGGFAPDAILSGTNETRVLVGYPLGTSYTVIYKGVDPVDGLPIWLDGAGKLTKVYPDITTGRRAAGKLIPDWTGGFGTNVKFKGFELNALFAYSTGLQIWDNSGKKQFLGVSSGVDWNVRQEFFDRWTQPGDVSFYPRMVYDKLYPGVSNADAFSSSMFLYDADYLRMRELTLAYNFASSSLRKLKVSNMRLFFTATNLFLWTKYKGGDPEVNRDADGGSTDRNMSPNVNYLTAPQAKTFHFGFNINF